MSKKSVHVVPRGPNGWAVEWSGGPEIEVTKTQKEAIDAGTRVAKLEKAELIIHGADGQIRERNSYGNDPNPPKG